jgi:hypothetical protein
MMFRKCYATFSESVRERARDCCAVMFIDGTDRYLPTKAESGSLRTGVGV